MEQTSTIKETLSSLPHAPGVYLFKDARKRVLYVGKAVSLRNRVRSYFQDSAPRSLWIGRMMQQVAAIDTIVTNSEKEALILEGNLIKMHHPRFNIRFRDDKQYPYLKVTMQDRFPMLVDVRTPKPDGARYFGPYSNTTAMRQTQDLCKRIFKIASGTLVADTRFRGCKWRDQEKFLDRPCLEFFIECCSAPCVAAIQEEEYRRAAEEVCAFLEGRFADVTDQLRARMLEASEALDFERAARYRDQFQAVERVVEKQQVVSLQYDDQDVFTVALAETLACVQMLVVRSGKLIGEQHFFIEPIEDRSEADILNAFLKQHYEMGAAIPREVLVPMQIEDAGVISEWLADRRGALVQVLQPQRGRKRKLLELADRNAEMALREIREQQATQERVSGQLLADLQEKLALPRLPRRIECFDISNVQGRQAVGSMVVFGDAVADRRSYRRFNIKLVEERPNDYAMMREVLRRRFARSRAGDPKFGPLPDLLIVDGGKGQLGCAMEILDEDGLFDTVPCAALAKQHELVFRPGRADPIALPMNSPALKLLQRIRDEAHRFAIEHHRSRRGRAQTQSVLDKVPGIGEQRRKQLLRHFGSLKRMRAASLDELAAAPGMPRPVAQALFEYLREED